ncbi:Protein of uncharacterised function (DUF3750) [Atlantibacter hermannii]|nr:Protein of uncharacterised function (DUF3750) [Atlantibacter hermannii]
MTLIKTLSLSFLCIVLLSLIASIGRAMYHPNAKAQEGWWSARHDSAGLAPDPWRNAGQAVVQVYAAPTWGWKGVVAVHPWIIFKRAGETQYSRYEVISWGAGEKVRHNRNAPDGYWYGAKPRLLVQHHGDAAQAMIPQIEAAIASYPWRTPIAPGLAPTATPLSRTSAAKSRRSDWICPQTPWEKISVLCATLWGCRRRGGAFRFRYLVWRG